MESKEERVCGGTLRSGGVTDLADRPRRMDKWLPPMTEVRVYGRREVDIGKFGTFVNTFAIMKLGCQSSRG